MRLPKSPAIMASGISTKFFPENSHELCERVKLLPQEKQAGTISDMINKLLENKCISTKQHNYNHIFKM